MKRKSRTRKPHGVELNLAAMLDMAFQLLAFFVLTFRPAPVEAQISIRMPSSPAESADSGVPTFHDVTASQASLIRSVNTLTISVRADAMGTIQSLSVDREAVGGLARLDERLRRRLSAPESPLEQVVVEAGGDLRYDALLHVIEICMRQSLADGRPLTRLRLVEVPGGV